MPTYPYRCTACAHEFETFQKFSDDPLTECPECGAEIRRVFQPVGIVFKGSGWYINDSRKQADKGEATSSAGKTETSETKSEKSDPSSPGTSSKPETAAPVKVAAD